MTIAAASSPVTEGTAAAFEVTLGEAAAEALTVTVSVTGDSSMLLGTPPASVTFTPGESGVILNVPTAADKVVEGDGTVTATVTPGTGYTVGSASSAAVTVEDDDVATFHGVRDTAEDLRVGRRGRDADGGDLQRSDVRGRPDGCTGPVGYGILA